MSFLGSFLTHQIWHEKGGSFGLNSEGSSHHMVQLVFHNIWVHVTENDFRSEYYKFLSNKSLKKNEQSLS